MTISKWSELPSPTLLDYPSISTEYASKGWDLLGTDNASGMVNVGYGDNIFKEIRGKEITVRKAQGKDVFLAEFKENGIVVANKTRMSLINGLIIKLQERLGFLNKLATEVELICFVCAKYFPFSSIEADHFQSHADIVQRMKAYWTKLDDEEFLNNQKTKPLFCKMFAVQKKNLVMTQFFQRGYVHSEDNLWPLCHECNGLANKNNADPFTFLLGQERYGKDFLASLPKINAKGILIRAGNEKKVLAQYAIEWFVDNMKAQILSRQLFANLQLKVEKKFEKKVAEGDEVKTAKLMQRLKAAIEDSDTDDDFDEELYKKALKASRKQVRDIYEQLKADKS